MIFYCQLIVHFTKLTEGIYIIISVSKTVMMTMYGLICIGVADKQEILQD